MKLAIILGTRPEIIKMSPIIKYCINNKIEYVLIHTGQHYDYNMDKIFFEELGIPLPNYNLGICCGSQGEQAGKMLIAIEKTLVLEKPDIVLVHGDVNSTLAGAMSASKLHIPLAHIEAGLRSFDRTMAEELNRIIVDHLSDLLFVPTQTSFTNLIKEGIDQKKIFIVGNTIADVLKDIKIPEQHRKKYILLTLHRPENVDNKERLQEITESLEQLSINYGIQIVFPIHPRTKKNMDEFGIKLNSHFEIISPIGYKELLSLEKYAILVISDSGGLQEEANILHVPHVTIRDNTERPEVIDINSNVLANPSNLIEMCDMMISSDRKWDNPFGDGNTAKRVIETVMKWKQE